MVEKTITLTGVSANSIEDAVQLAVSRAAVTIEGIRRVQIIDVGGDVENGNVDGRAGLWSWNGPPPAPNAQP